MGSMCVKKFLNNIYLQRGKIVLTTNGKYTFITLRLLDLLSVKISKNARVLGANWLDGRFKILYKK